MEIVFSYIVHILMKLFVKEMHAQSYDVMCSDLLSKKRIKYMLMDHFH